MLDNQALEMNSDSRNVRTKCMIQQSNDLSSMLRLARPCLPSSFSKYVKGWLEHSSEDGEAWLRAAAQSGITAAQTELGMRMLEGNGMSRSPSEGIALLKAAAGRGDLRACELLGCQLADNDDPRERSLGAEFLRRAIRNGRTRPAVALALRMLTPPRADIEELEAFDLLVSAAESGDPVALGILARRLAEGSKPAQAQAWYQRADVTSSDGLSTLGVIIYEAALCSRTPIDRDLLFSEAAGLLLIAWRAGSMTAGLNLALMLRRKEVDPARCPPIDRLLNSPLLSCDPFAIVNQALRKAAGFDCAIDWFEADRLVGMLRGSAGVYEWWFGRLLAGDPEGHLVIAWLIRHGLTTDPDSLSVTRRLGLATGGPFDIPQWLHGYKKA
jgi:hypothetical protein